MSLCDCGHSKSRHWPDAQDTHPICDGDDERFGATSCWGKTLGGSVCMCSEYKALGSYIDDIRNKQAQLVEEDPRILDVDDDALIEF